MERADNLEEVILGARAMDNFFRVISHFSDYFQVETPSGIVQARARGKLKKNEILVGDFVTLTKEGETFVIDEVKERENSLIRPSVANVDLIVIVVAPKPETDLFLVDKLIINCRRVGIDCAICVNKSDIASVELAKDLSFQYKNDVVAVVTASAILGKVDELLPVLEGKLVCFAGQSAVGKSTLSNAILGDNSREVGDLSEKIGRGKNTTTSATILKGKGFSFIDTPGFSMLDVFEPDPEALASYYAEFVSHADECKFHPCTHTSEPDCAVKKAVDEGKISEERYLRYTKLYEESKLLKKFRRR